MSKEGNPFAAEVTQTDRDAAAALFSSGNEISLIAAGEWDSHSHVQAFARHHQQAIAQHEGGRGEPVAWMYEKQLKNLGFTRFLDEKRDIYAGGKGWTETPLYAHPPATRPAALAEDAVEALVEPWKDYHGDLPDFDHPLRCVYESGIQYAVELLAKTLNVENYEVCDGTEEFDGDLGGTMFNIVLAALPKDEDGDPYHPRELHQRITQQAEEVARLREALKPFADKASLPDGAGKHGFITMPASAFRAARAALNEQPGGEEK